MQTYSKTLLVVFAEAALERLLVEDAKRFGVHGYTAWDVRGASQLGSAQPHVRESAWEGDRTVEIKIVCSPEQAQSFGEYILTQYSQNYGVSLYFADVKVLRKEKF